MGDQALRDLSDSLNEERITFRQARERLQREAKETGRFTASQRALLALLSEFVAIAVDDMPPSDQDAINESRQLMKRFAQTVLERSETDADELMKEFSAQVLAGMRSARDQSFGEAKPKAKRRAS